MLHRITGLLVMTIMTVFFIFGAAQAATVAVVSIPVNMVEYVSGGIGKGERDSMKNFADEFDMKLVFADDQGRFLSNVIVLIENAEGDTVLHSVSHGPWFYVELPDGIYSVTAVFAEESKSTEVAVGDDLTTQNFTWELTSDS